MQTTEKTVNATNEEAAVKKIEEELAKPYGFLGGWQTTGTEVEIVEAVPALGESVGPLPGGPLLLSIKDAAKHLGISYGTLYELLNRGEVEYVRLGRRKLIGRDALNKFIEANTQTGYSSYRS